MRQMDEAIKKLEKIKNDLPEHLKDPLEASLESYIDLCQEWSDKLQTKIAALIMAKEKVEERGEGR